MLPPLPAHPLVSVIVPSYNQGRFIRQTIDSILAQDYRPVEVWVMDGASTDETVDVLRSFGEREELNWVSERDSGVVEAVNKGFAKARGAILAIQSSDDVYLPGAVAAAVEALRSVPDVGLVYGHTVKVDEAGRELARQPVGPYSLRNLLLRRTYVPQPAAFFRRELLDALGGWDERIPYTPDTDMWIRFAFHCEVLKIDRYLSQRRMHGEQRDTQAAKIVRDYDRMILQSTEIRNAPADLRRAAHAGRFLLRQRYNPYGSDWYMAWNLVRAGLYCPEVFSPREFLRHAVTLPIRRRLSWLKQKVLGKEASA